MPTSTPTRPKKTKPTAPRPAAAIDRKLASSSGRRLASVWRLGRQSVEIVWRNRRLFGPFVLLYGVFSLLLVRGFAASVDSQTLRDVLNSGIGTILGGLGNYALLISSVGSPGTATGSLYQTVLVLIFSLACIWLLRNAFAGTTAVRVRDAFYQGMYPLVPVLLVGFVICLELLPLAVSAAVYSAVIQNGIAASIFEIIIWGVGCIILAGLSVFWVTSSIFAIYIAALPDMTPLRALRSSHGLVRYRRWTVLRKNLFLPLALLIVSLVIMLPVILLVTAVAPWLFFVLSILALPFAHAYMYGLYRELLA